MTNLNIQLLDTGEDFILVSADTETEIKYGDLAISLVNTNYDDIYNLIADFLQSNRILRLAMDLQHSPNTAYNTGTIKPNIINHILKTLYKPLYGYLRKDYLTSEQASITTLLLIADILSRLDNGKIDLDNPEFYIPLIYSDQDLHQHIRNVLLQQDFAYDSPLQDKINQIQLTSSIILTSQGEPFQSYTITNIFDYLILDLQKYLTGKTKVKECLCCHKLFKPIYRSSEKYCCFNNSACKEKMKKTPNDSFRAKQKEFRGYQSGRIGNVSTENQYPREFLKSIYKTWSRECTIKFNEFKINDDLKGFDDWFKATKFTADTLKNEYEKWLKQQNNA